LETDIGYFEYF
jgi:hypothetical protein